METDLFLEPAEAQVIAGQLNALAIQGDTGAQQVLQLLRGEPTRLYGVSPLDALLPPRLLQAIDAPGEQFTRVTVSLGDPLTPERARLTRRTAEPIMIHVCEQLRAAGLNVADPQKSAHELAMIMRNRLEWYNPERDARLFTERAEMLLGRARDMQSRLQSGEPANVLEITYLVMAATEIPRRAPDAPAWPELSALTDQLALAAHPLSRGFRLPDDEGDDEWGDEA
ncbi:hypothetical protein [Deinococcus arenicola]|uniref:Uncharacterized protein n=1 Tax=Deinococcus arenicola TaxID=2994950 RepID=A0ABU4DWK8_9DEIO|nr:hypothetical protein [Deinococcus sp. ZS9-10]MDV6376439.1 hypothetical protein [Deinococcus sp. ZS9-10]